MTLYRVLAKHPSNGEGELCTVETDSPTKAEAYYRTVAGGIPSSWEVTVTPLVTMQMPRELWDALTEDRGLNLVDVTEFSAPASLDMSKVPDFARDIIEAQG